MLHFVRITSFSWLLCVFTCKLIEIHSHFFKSSKYSFTSSSLHPHILPFQACGRKCCKSFTHDGSSVGAAVKLSVLLVVSISRLDSRLFVSPPTSESFYSHRVLRKLTNHTTKEEKERESEKKEARGKFRKIS